MTSQRSQVFSSITPDKIELASRKSRQWTREDLPNRMIYDITCSDQLRDLSTSDLTLTRCEHLMLTPPKQKCTILTNRSMTNIMVLKSRLCAVFLTKLFFKTRNRILALGALDLTLRGHQLTSDFLTVHQSLRPRSRNGIHACFSREASSIRARELSRPLSWLGRRYVKKKTKKSGDD